MDLQNTLSGRWGFLESKKKKMEVVSFGGEVYHHRLRTVIVVLLVKKCGYIENYLWRSVVLTLDRFFVLELWWCSIDILGIKYI
jgi:hypothetical protein